MEKAGFWRRLFGRPDEALGENREPELRARVAALEMEVRDRDELIATLRREYAALEAAKERAAASAGDDRLERLFKSLASPLSNLAALAALAESGREVACADLIQLFQSVEGEMARAGLERIGQAGQSMAFDVAAHQRMSGGTVHTGSQVVVRAPGYRMGAKILLKAMVTAQEAAHE